MRPISALPPVLPPPIAANYGISMSRPHARSNSSRASFPSGTRKFPRNLRTVVLPSRAGEVRLERSPLHGQTLASGITPSDALTSTSPNSLARVPVRAVCSPVPAQHGAANLLRTSAELCTIVAHAAARFQALQLGRASALCVHSPAQSPAPQPHSGEDGESESEGGGGGDRAGSGRRYCKRGRGSEGEGGQTGVVHSGGQCADELAVFAEVWPRISLRSLRPAQSRHRCGQGLGSPTARG